MQGKAFPNEEASLKKKSPRRSAPGHTIIQGHFGSPHFVQNPEKNEGCAIHLLVRSIIIG